MAPEQNGTETETATTSEPRTDTEEPTPTETVTPEKMISESDALKDKDRAVSQALKKREATLLEEQETERLKANEDHKALADRQEKKIRELKDDATRSDFIAKHGLGAFETVLKATPVEQLGAMKVSLETSVNAAVLEKVSEKLETPKPPGGKPVPEVAIADMSPEQYQQYKKGHGIT